MDKLRMIKENGIVWINEDWHGHVNDITLDKNIGKQYSEMNTLNKSMLDRLETGEVKRIVCKCD